MEIQNKIQKPWYKKTWVIIFGVLIVLVYIGNLGDDKSANVAEPSQTYIATPDQSNTKQWTKVYSFKGNGMKKSPVFELKGNEARVRYKYEAPSGLGMGMFAVYVVDEGSDIMKDGGIPEAMSSAEKEDTESSIQKSAGRYYLSVNASGLWEVTIEEMR